MAPAELSIRALMAGWFQIQKFEEPTGLAISSLRMFLSSSQRESRHSSGELDRKKAECVEGIKYLCILSLPGRLDIGGAVPRHWAIPLLIQ